ncbi:hypothetical protein [Endozoicomonas sp.]|uniref:hypothetical protein n=1 Tax=Endozoicomonas sp. TaxID=1892382 RepID=UPI003AF598BB
MSNHQHYIAGRNTIRDWQHQKMKLEQNSSPDIWSETYEGYFKPRLELRYLHPIKILKEHGTFQGEGFSIMTILCSLIEFLESSYQGKSYKFLKNGEKLGEYEYSSSKAIFKSFLTKRSPFSAEFSDDLAEEFYSSIRCGLLHEASTKKGWRIWAQSPNGKIIQEDTKIVYRDMFEKSIKSFILNYGNELASDQNLQKAFIRKLDTL